MKLTIAAALLSGAPALALALPQGTITPHQHQTVISVVPINNQPLLSLPLNATSWLSSPLTLTPRGPDPGAGAGAGAGDDGNGNGAIKSGLLTTTIWSDGHAYTVTQFSEVGPLSSLGLTTSVADNNVLTTVPATVPKSGTVEGHDAGRQQTATATATATAAGEEEPDSWSLVATLSQAATSTSAKTMT